MDDLISRQELLESIERISVKGNVLDDDWIYRFIQEFPSAQPDTDSRIEQAIRVLQKNYNLALSRDYIRNPIAWALYETWKEFDR